MYCLLTNRILGGIQDLKAATALLNTAWIREWACAVFPFTQASISARSGLR